MMDTMDMMDTMEAVTRAIGPPRVAWEFRTGARLDAAVGRWRHRGAWVDLSGSDSFQLIFNISGGQRVDLQWGSRFVSTIMRAGTLGVVVPDHAPAVNVAGPADILQVFLSRQFVDAVGGDIAIGDRRHVGPSDPELQAAAVQMLVALSRPRSEDRGETYQLLRTIAHRLFGHGECEPANGGLAPAQAMRVNALIEGRFCDMPTSLPAIAELAATCGLTKHHFIRAFRKSTGQTPHAHMANLRLDASLRRLLCGSRVDETADALGFSSPSHFVSAFRLRMGVTPGALRHAVVA